MLTYYKASPGQAFWSDHWGQHSVEELLAIARRSPLTTLITRALPAAGIILEAGCGLGQYVLLLRERGWRVAGADWSIEALAMCRRAAPAPLAAMTLDALAVRDGALAAYVSLGAVEHDERGPDAILAEARRALAPGGVLVLSVPYENGARRVAAPWLRRQGRAQARRGVPFYQYAFTRRELYEALTRLGFRVTSTAPYDPARLLRHALPRAVARRLTTPPTASADASAPTAGVSSTTTEAPGATSRDGAAGRGSRRAGTSLRNLARRLLYTEPALRFLGHMLLVVARKV